MLLKLEAQQDSSTYNRLTQSKQHCVHGASRITDLIMLLYSLIGSALSILQNKYETKQNR